METKETEVHRLGASEKKLSFFDVIAQSVGFLAPVFSVAFLVPLVVGLISATGKGAGVAAPLSIIFGGIGITCVAYNIAQYAKRISAAGSLYDYVTDGLGSHLGGAAGFIYYVGIVILGGGTLSTRVQMVLAGLSFLTVLLFSLHVIFSVGSANHVAKAFTPSSAPGGWSGLLFGMVYGVLIFTGFETSANLAEESAEPKRHIPRAIFGSLAIVTIFYLICSYAQVAGYHFDLGAMAKNIQAPLFGLAASSSQGGYGNTAIRRLLELVVVLDMLALMVGLTVSSSRGIFAMARDERFPSVLAKTSKRSTPWNASVLVLGVYLVFLIVTLTVPSLFALPQTPHYFAMFSWGSSFGGVCLTVIYLLVSVGALRGLRDANRYWLVVVTAVIGIFVTGAALFGAIYKVAAPTIYAVWVAAAVFIIGLIASIIAKGGVATSTSFEPLNKDRKNSNFARHGSHPIGARAEFPR